MMHSLSFSILSLLLVVCIYIVTTVENICTKCISINKGDINIKIINIIYYTTLYMHILYATAYIQTHIHTCEFKCSAYSLSASRDLFQFWHIRGTDHGGTENSPVLQEASLQCLHTLPNTQEFVSRGETSCPRRTQNPK